MVETYVYRGSEAVYVGMTVTAICKTKVKVVEIKWVNPRIENGLPHMTMEFLGVKADL